MKVRQTKQGKEKIWTPHLLTDSFIETNQSVDRHSHVAALDFFPPEQKVITSLQPKQHSKQIPSTRYGC